MSIIKINEPLIKGLYRIGNTLMTKGSHPLGIKDYADYYKKTQKLYNEQLKKLIQQNINPKDFLIGANIHEPVGKHKIPRYLYHITSEYNFKRMKSAKTLDFPLYGKREFYMFNLQNMINHWKRSIVDELSSSALSFPPIIAYLHRFASNFFYPNLSLLPIIAGAKNKLVLLRIPTSKLAVMNLSIREYPEDSLIMTSALNYKLLNQRKKGLEWVYRGEINVKDFKVIGKSKVSDKSLKLSETESLAFWKKITKGQPEYRAFTTQALESKIEVPTAKIDKKTLISGRTILPKTQHPLGMQNYGKYFKKQQEFYNEASLKSNKFHNPFTDYPLLAGANIKGPVGKHKIPRYLYHLTNAKNYKRMLKANILHPEKTNQPNFFMFDLQNLINHFKSPFGDNDNLQWLLHLATKGNKKLVLLRIPTEKLNLSKLTMNEYPVSKWSLGTPAINYSLAKQNKKSLEFVYSGRLDTNIFEKVGSYKLPLTYTETDYFSEKAALNVWQKLTKKQPENKAFQTKSILERAIERDKDIPNLSKGELYWSLIKALFKKYFPF